MKSSFVAKVLFGLVAISAFLTMGCDPDDPVSSRQGGTDVTDPFPWAKSTTSTYGAFSISARTATSGSTTYLSGGKLYSDSNHSSAASGGQMTAGDLTVNHNSDFGYLSAGQPTFGAMSTWALAGDATNGIPAFTDSMYVPAVVVMSLPTTPGSTLSKGSGFTIQWNTDANNDTVVVGFRYDMATSNYVDTSLSDSEYGWFRLVPDNGSYTIPSSALDSVPVGGYIDVIVARGASKLSGTSTRKFHIYGTTMANGLFKVTS